MSFRAHRGEYMASRARRGGWRWPGVSAHAEGRLGKGGPAPWTRRVAALRPETTWFPLLNPPPVGAEAKQGGEEGGQGRAWRGGGGSGSPCPRGRKVRKRGLLHGLAVAPLLVPRLRGSPLLNPPPVGAEAKQGGEEGGRGRAWRGGGGSRSPCPRGGRLGRGVCSMDSPWRRCSSRDYVVPPPQSSPGGGGGPTGRRRGTRAPSRIAASTASVLESTSLFQNLRTRYPWRANQASRAASAEAPCCPPSTSTISDRASQ